MTSGEATAGEVRERKWFGHPRPLGLLFATEAWERFGYYGMRALLTLYLMHHFVFSDNVAYGLYGAFTSLVYLTPLIGGFIADRYFGSKNSVKFGAVLMSIGYLLLAFGGGEPAKPYVIINNQRYDVQIVAKSEDDITRYVISGDRRHKIIVNKDGITLEGATGALPATAAKGTYTFDGERDPVSVIILFVALGIIIVGNGYFKPNISTIVGSLYSETDRRRDAGFTIFYMGINLGSIFSQFLAPILAAAYGYKWGFALAGGGMLIAWFLFQFFGPTVLREYGNRPEGGKNRDLLIFAGSLVAIPVVWFLLNNAMETAAIAQAAAHGGGGGVIEYLVSQPLLGQVMFAVFFAAMIGIPIWALVTLKKVEAHRMIVAVILTFFSVVFWTLFEQAGSSLTAFADRNTDLSLGTLPFLGPTSMPAAQTQVFNPIFIVLFAPLFSIMWNWLGKRGLEPSVPFKFVIGLFLVGVGFLVLVYGSQFHDSGFQVPLFWLAFAYFIHSIGELCLSPVGLSMITKLSILRLVGMMMGVWFLSSAMAQYVGGIIAQFAATETVGGQVLNPEAALNTSLAMFEVIGYAGIGSAVLLLVLTPFLRKAMHGIN
jgi:proton-dependent oligopeptide transporter, POT family